LVGFSGDEENEAELLPRCFLEGEGGRVWSVVRVWSGLGGFYLVMAEPPRCTRVPWLGPGLEVSLGLAFVETAV
jgi:hypothetical protein